MNKGPQHKKTGKRMVSNILILLLFAVGACVLLYPAVSNMINQYRNAQLTVYYQDAVSGLSGSQRAEIWKKARKYNAEHRVNAITDAFDSRGVYTPSHRYSLLLNPSKNGVMGYIDIPRMKQKLAIYHGTQASSLEKGAGHIEGTSLPVGGRSTHCVIAAHRGLPGAKLFTDMDKMKKGDCFFLHVMNRTLAYKVDQILVVKPGNTEALNIVEGKDYVTLVTCTPYGVNSHRLLVRGHRVHMNENKDGIPTRLSIVLKMLLLAAALAALLTLLLKKMFGRKDRKNRKNNHDKNRKTKKGAERDE